MDSQNPQSPAVFETSSGAGSATGKKKRRGKKKGTGNQDASLNQGSENSHEDVSISENSLRDVDSQEEDSRHASVDFGLTEVKAEAEAEAAGTSDAGRHFDESAHAAGFVDGQLDVNGGQGQEDRSGRKGEERSDSPVFEERTFDERPPDAFSGSSKKRAGREEFGDEQNYDHNRHVEISEHANESELKGKMALHEGESFADALRAGTNNNNSGHVREETHIVEEHHNRSHGGTETFVRNDDHSQGGPSYERTTEVTETFQRPSHDNSRGRGSINGQESYAGAAAQHFTRVQEQTRAALNNIVDGDYHHQQTGGQTSQDSFSNGGAHAEVNQRRPYGYEENGSVYQPSAQFETSVGGNKAGVQQPQDYNTQFSQQQPQDYTLDSPMAEFDAEKRRNNNGVGGVSGGGQLGGRGRRSRPLGQLARDLVFWRNAKDSGVIFTFGLILLLSLSFFSIISIFAYLSMTSLILITSFVLIKQITMAFQQQASEHPFKVLLDKDVVISPDYAHQQLDTVLKPLNGTLLRIRNLYLADSLGQTLKLIFIMYILTYIGSWFNLLTLLTIIWVGAFTLPKFYVTYKEQIDSVIHVVLEGLRDLKAQVVRLVNQQLNKIKPANRRTVLEGDGQIRTKNGQEKIQAEVKTSGGKVSAKYEKKTTEKIQ